LERVGSLRSDGRSHIDDAGAYRAMALTLIENFRAVFYARFYAAFALNAYEAEGVEVQRVMGTNPAETAQALRSGQGDVGWGGPIRLLLDNNQQPDSDLVIFCEVVRRDPFFLVGREPKPAWQGSIRHRSGTFATAPCRKTSRPYALGTSRQCRRSNRLWSRLWRQAWATSGMPPAFDDDPRHEIP
jgi:hypothetical protein